jgi:RNA polymerase sigma-70 factor (ECF subfamily)
MDVVAVERGASEPEEPFDAIYRRYAEELLKFATLLVGASDARDVVHDAIVNCLRSAGWAAVVNQRAYLRRAVFNQAQSFCRARSRRQDREQRAAAREPVAFRDPEVDPEVGAAARRLCGRQRQVIALTYWEDLTPEQVAERLGIRVGTVKRHLARGREALRRIISDG